MSDNTTPDLPVVQNRCSDPLIQSSTEAQEENLQSSSRVKLQPTYPHKITLNEF